MFHWRPFLTTSVFRALPRFPGLMLSVFLSATLSVASVEVTAQDLSLRDAFFRKLSRDTKKNLIINIDQSTITRLDGPEIEEDTFELIVFLQNEWPESSRSFSLKSVPLKRVDLGRFNHNRYPPATVLEINRSISVPMEQIKNMIEADFEGYRHTSFEVCAAIKSVGKYHNEPVAESCTNLIALLQEPQVAFEVGSKQPSNRHWIKLFQRSAYYSVRGSVSLEQEKSQPTIPLPSEQEYGD